MFGSIIKLFAPTKKVKDEGVSYEYVLNHLNSCNRIQGIYMDPPHKSGPDSLGSNHVLDYLNSNFNRVPGEVEVLARRKTFEYRDYKKHRFYLAELNVRDELSSEGLNLPYKEVCFEYCFEDMELGPYFVRSPFSENRIGKISDEFKSADLENRLKSPEKHSNYGG